MLRDRHIVTFVLVFALAVAGVPVPPASAQETAAPQVPEIPGSGVLKGKVTGPGGKGKLAGVVVHAYHVDTGSIHSSDPTRSNGQFKITGLSHGYYDIAAELDGHVYVANTVVNVPPSGAVSVDMALTDFADLPEGTGRSLQGYEFPGLSGATEGIASVEEALRGRDFWRSKKGVAVLAGGGAVLLLAIALSSKEDSSSPVVSPSNP